MFMFNLNLLPIVCAIRLTNFSWNIAVDFANNFCPKPTLFLKNRATKVCLISESKIGRLMGQKRLYLAINMIFQLQVGQSSISSDKDFLRKNEDV